MRSAESGRDQTPPRRAPIANAGQRQASPCTAHPGNCHFELLLAPALALAQAGGAKLEATQLQKLARRDEVVAARLKVRARACRSDCSSPLLSLPPPPLLLARLPFPVASLDSQVGVDS